MTKKKWKKNMMALMVKCYAMYGRKMNGVNVGKFYRDHTFNDFNNYYKSYSEAWKDMEVFRKRVGM